MTEEIAKKKTNKTPIIIGVILLIGAVIGIKEYLYYSHVETTDDAQVISNINPVVARISDYVTDINFQDNQHVTKGQVLVKLDDKDLTIKEQQMEAELLTAQANVAVAKANAASAESGLATTKSEIDAAQITVWKTTQDFARYQSLIKDGSVTQEQYDNSKAAKDAAESQLEIAKNKNAASEKQYQVTVANATSVQSAITRKQADLDYAKLQLSYATITAPVSGTISKRSIQVGQLVQAGSSLLAIVEDSVWVEANFKETQMNDIKLNQTASVQIDALDGGTISGTISSFSPGTGAVFSLLPPDNAAGNYVKVVQRVPIRIALDSKSASYKILRPGLSVEVTVQIK